MDLWKTVFLFHVGLIQGILFASKNIFKHSITRVDDRLSIVNQVHFRLYRDGFCDRGTCEKTDLISDGRLTCSTWSGGTRPWGENPFWNTASEEKDCCTLSHSTCMF